MNKKLDIIDAETLADMRLEPVKFSIENILPQGIAMISGAPKIGKSWLMLDWCLKIAKGEPVWNFKTNQGTTLYLCLEDNWNRIQNRLLNIVDEVPNNLFFAVSSCSLADGLAEQMENFVQEHNDTVLIVIDTFQMVRSAERDTNYANDYQEIVQLKSLADRLKITVLLVHHLRKQNDSDPLNKISGTTGISGALDTTLILERKERNQNKAVLICTGRDIEHRELELCFSRENHTWEFISDSVEESVVLLPEEMRWLIEFMKQKKLFSGTNSDFSSEFNSYCNKNIETNVLKRLMNKYRYELENQSVYFESKRCNGKRLLRIFYCACCESADSDDKDDKFMGAKNIVNIVPIVPVATRKPP